MLTQLGAHVTCELPGSGAHGPLAGSPDQLAGVPAQGPLDTCSISDIIGRSHTVITHILGKNLGASFIMPLID